MSDPDPIILETTFLDNGKVELLVGLGNLQRHRIRISRAEYEMTTHLEIGRLLQSLLRDLRLR